MSEVVGINKVPLLKRLSEWTKLNRQKAALRVVLVVGFLILIVGGGYLYWVSKHDPNALVYVGNEKVTKSDLNKAIYSLHFAGSPDSPTTTVNDELRKTLMDKLVEKKIIAQEAAKLGVSVSDSDVTAEAIKRDSDYNRRTPDQKDIIFNNAKSDLLAEKVKDKVLSWAEGDFVMVRFDQYLNGSTADQSKYETDKTEADKVAKKAIYELQQGVPFETVQKEIASNPVIGDKSWQDLDLLPVLGGKATKQNMEERGGVLADPEFYSMLMKSEVGKVSGPTLMKVKVSLDADSPNTESKDGYYVLYKLNSKNKTDYSDYETWLNDKKTEYLKDKSFLQEFLSIAQPQKAYARWVPGSCGGGLVNSGSSNYAGFWVHMYYYDAGGTRYNLSGSTITLNSNDSGTFSGGGSTRSCSSQGMINTGTSPDSFARSHTFSSASDGMIYLGYKSCDGNGWAMSCSCVSYHANFSFGGFSGDNGGGRWVSTNYYFLDGTNKVYGTDNTWDFGGISNGNTVGMYVNYQEDRPPVAGFNSPANGTVYTLSSGQTYMTTPPTFYSHATDADSDSVGLRSAYYRWNGSAWALIEYIPSGGYTGWYPQDTGAHLLGTPTATNMIPGSYKWRVWAQDSRGITNSAGGADGTVSGAAGEWTFTINPPACSITQPFGASVSLNGAQYLGTFTFGLSNTATWTLNYGDGTAVVNNPTSGITHVYTTPGLYTATLTATGCATQTVAVNISPSCSVTGTATSSTSGYIPLNVTFGGTASNTYAGKTQQFLWDYLNNGSGSWVSTIPGSYNYTSAYVGNAVIRSRLNDGTSCGSTNIPISAQTPPAVTSCVVSPSAGLSPLTVRVDFATSGTTISNIYMDWTNALDKLDQGVKPTPFYFTYNKPGQYTVHAKANNVGGYVVPELDCSVVVGKDGGGNPIIVAPPSPNAKVTVGTNNSGSGGETSPNH